MLAISTYGLQIIRATDVIFLSTWQLNAQTMDKKEAHREEESQKMYREIIWDGTALATDFC